MAYVPMSKTRWYLERAGHKSYVYQDTFEGARRVYSEHGFLLAPNEPAPDTEEWHAPFVEGLTFRERKKGTK